MSNLDSNFTKKSTELTLIDKLSRLSYSQTVKLLGSDAPKLLRDGNKWEFRIDEDVYLGEDLFRLRFPQAPGETESAPVAVTSLTIGCTGAVPRASHCASTSARLFH